MLMRGPGAGALGGGALPVPLEPPTGDEKVAPAEAKGPRPAAPVRADQEPAGLPERNEDHDGVFDLLGDAVPVPGHAVPAIAVQVHSGGVELDPVAAGQQ